MAPSSPSGSISNDANFEGHDRVATFSVAGLAALKAFEE
jgi:hypothetical protein